MELFDLGTIVLSAALLFAPLTLRSVGGWAWAAWLPPRLRAIENRRALVFIEKLVRIVAQGRQATEEPPTIDERSLLDDFIEVADSIVRVLPDFDEAEDRTSERPVSDLLRNLATKALEHALLPAGNGDDPERRTRLARVCLEILRKLPNPANTAVLRQALRSANPAIVQQTTSVIASAPHALRAAIAPPDDAGDPKIYRAQ